MPKQELGSSMQRNDLSSYLPNSLKSTREQCRTIPDSPTPQPVASLEHTVRQATGSLNDLSPAVRNDTLSAFRHLTVTS